MKRPHPRFTTVFLAVLTAACCCSSVSTFAQKNKKKDEEANPFSELNDHCTGRPRDQRPVIMVKRFTIAHGVSTGAVANFGAMMAGKLTNAMMETQCFNVVEADISDAKDEMNMEDEGFTDGSGPQRGQMKGAQYIVSAEVTEYVDGSSSSSFGGSSFRVRTGKQEASVGVTLKIWDPQTRVRMYSKEIIGTGKGKGGGGFSIGGVYDNSSSSQLNKALNAAVNDCIYQMAEKLVMDYDKIGFAAPSTPTAGSQSFDPSKCKMLANGKSPRIMVILPEYHIQRRIPDPAGETEILRKFVEAGFQVVDPSMYAKIYNGARFDEAAKDPMKAISLGKEFGADIVIFGEAFSSTGARDGKNVTSRARVETRAVRTDNAQILAINGFDAGSQDIDENTGAKRALRDAGGKMANYLLQQLCSKDMQFSGR